MKVFQDKRLFIFDFDGTLVDSSAIHEHAFQEVLKPWNISVHYQDIVGMKTKDAMIKLLNLSGFKLPSFKIEQLIQKKQQISRHLISSYLQLMPYVKDFLYQASTFHELVVVSAGSKQSVCIGLEKFKLNHLFKLVIAADDVNYAKPHPEGFLMALEKMQFYSHQALIFEDSEPGFLAAKAAGIDYINVNHFNWVYSS